MDESTAKKIRELATIQQIARRPSREQPLLAVILAQAKALDEIASWAGNAARVATQAAEKAEDATATP